MQEFDIMASWWAFEWKPEKPALRTIGWRVDEATMEWAVVVGLRWAWPWRYG